MIWFVSGIVGRFFCLFGIICLNVFCGFVLFEVGFCVWVGKVVRV